MKRWIVQKKKYVCFSPLIPQYFIFLFNPVQIVYTSNIYYASLLASTVEVVVVRGKEGKVGTSGWCVDQKGSDRVSVSAGGGTQEVNNLPVAWVRHDRSPYLGCWSGIIWFLFLAIHRHHLSRSGCVKLKKCRMIWVRGPISMLELIMKFISQLEC